MVKKTIFSQKFTWKMVYFIKDNDTLWGFLKIFCDFINIFKEIWSEFWTDFCGDFSVQRSKFVFSDSFSVQRSLNWITEFTGG